jgi:hypothetical protein
MFGLSENNDKNETNTSVNGSDNPMAPTNGGAVSSEPSVTSPSTSALPSDPSNSSNDSGSTNDVNLGNAYIANDPLNAKHGDDSSSAKPTAASLLNNTPEDDLIKLKQQALQNLAPLVDHLDQSAEEKFKTTMMLIQASDNAELIQDAYAAANKIQDEKVRAQALLDVVNEINYFTQHSGGGSGQAAE